MRVVDLVIVIVWVVFWAYWLVAARAAREEAFLTEQFQDTYRAYKRSTKMLIPFVL